MHVNTYGRHHGRSRVYVVRLGSGKERFKPQVWADRDGITPQQRARVDRELAQIGQCDVLIVDPIMTATFLADFYACLDATGAEAVA